MCGVAVEIVTHRPPELPTVVTTIITAHAISTPLTHPPNNEVKSGTSPAIHFNTPNWV